MEPELGYYSIWPVMVCTAVVTLLISTPLFRALNAPLAAHPHRQRVRSIDGLRGYLALAVVFYHVAILRLYLARGTFKPETWEPPPSRFFSLLGPAAVSVFFMITGYLFWSQVLGRRTSINWGQLYVGRLFRIGPLYLCAVVLALLLDHLSVTNYVARLNGVSTSITKQAMSLLLLGLSVYPDNNRLLAGVTWSIQYEWLFYLSLPVLSFLCRVRRWQIPLLVTALVACLANRSLLHNVVAGTRTAPVMAALFLVGMVCAALEEAGLQMQSPDWVKSLLTMILLGSVFAFRDVYTAGPVLLLGAAFWLISTGCSLFGLLSCRGAIRLGDVSYGVYLLQGLAFALCLRPGPLRAIFLRSPASYWISTLVTLVVLLSSATLTYLYIERRGIRLGRRITRSADKVRCPEPTVA